MPAASPHSGWDDRTPIASVTLATCRDCSAAWTTNEPVCPQCGSGSIVSSSRRRGVRPGEALRPDARRSDPETSKTRKPTWHPKYDDLFKYWMQHTYRLSGAAPSDTSLFMAGEELGLGYSAAGSHDDSELTAGALPGGIA